MQETENCPAFAEGCPYKDADESTKQNVAKCPAFEEGCPFKDVQTSGALQKKLKEVPPSHFTDENFKRTLMNVHNMNAKYEELLGKCPHFEEGCPFKTVTSEGVPLVGMLEKLTENRRGEITPEIEAILLSKELKSGTKEAHTRAETTHFVTEFVKGNVDEEFYATYLAQLYFIYQTLEQCCEQQKDHEHFKHLNYPELARIRTLERDLNYYLGFEWKNNITCLEPTKAYCKRIQECDGDLLLAHHYTRYLGDLSGGQILKKKAVRHYGLGSEGSGVQFYDFDKIPNLREFKQKYRSTLDDLELTKELATKIVEEANVSFNFNTDLFLELDKQLGLAPKPLVQKTEAEMAECPFGFKATQGAQKVATGTPIQHFVLLGIALLAYIFWRFTD